MRGRGTARALLPLSCGGSHGQGWRRRDLHLSALRLLAIYAILMLASGQSDPFEFNDIGVHKVTLYRKEGPEDTDVARRERNVLVS